MWTCHYKRHALDFPHRNFNVCFPPNKSLWWCTVASTPWICAVNSTLSVKCELFILEKPHTIRKTTTSKYERNFPPLVYVEKATISVYVETPRLFNIFSESVNPHPVVKLNFCSLDKVFILQHRDQGISSFIQRFFLESVLLWWSPNENEWSHWISMLRWIWPISEYNLNE